VQTVKQLDVSQHTTTLSHLHIQNKVKQCVALTGRDTTGQPRAAPWDYANRWRQTPPTVTSLALLHYV